MNSESYKDVYVKNVHVYRYIMWVISSYLELNALRDSDVFR